MDFMTFREAPTARSSLRHPTPHGFDRAKGASVHADCLRRRARCTIPPMRRLPYLLPLLVAVGCGGAQRPGDARRCPVARPVDEAQVVATQAQTRTLTSSDDAPSTREATDCDRGTLEANDAALSRQEARIADGLTALSTAGGDCARVCAAASGICEAAAEVCRLTGDGASRCARARASCDDATRRRSDACPVCPTP